MTPLMPLLMRRNHFVPLVEKTYEIPDDLIRPEPKSILLLEDDATLAEVLRNGLELNNYRVTRVRSGAEGIQLVIKQDFDILLCDMIMPNFPGDMFYRAVERARPYMCKRFVFMTGHSGDARIDQFIRSVRGLMIWKPFKIHELLQTMKVVLDKNSTDSLN